MITEIILSVVTLLAVGNTIFNKPKPEVVTDYRTIIIVAPTELTTDCEIQEPPTIDEYSKAASWDIKEKLLFATINQNYKNAIDCNTQMGSLRVWGDKQIKLYSDKKKLE
jgi:hypothetical protein